MAKQKAISRPATTTIPKAQKTPIWQHKHFGSGLVFLFAFFLFANSILNGYNLDDELVTINHRLTSKGISAIPEIFASPYYQDNQGYAYEYRPLVLVSFAIEHQIFGDSAAVSHFFNVLLYALCCVLLLKVLEKLFRQYSPLLPLAIALLFAAHTAHTEVVSSIKNRDEILSLIFGLASMWVTIGATRTGRQWLLFLLPVLFTLAMLSKVSILSFAVIIPLALMFFTDAGVGIVAATIILLLIPVLFLVDQDNSIEKIKTVVGLASISGIFLIVKNFRQILSGIKKSVYTITAGFSKEKEEEKPNQVVDSFKGIFTGIVPEKKILAPIPALISIILGGLYVALTAHFFSLIALVPLIALIALIFLGNEKISWWANIVFGFCLASNGLHAFSDLGFYHTYVSIVSKYLALCVVFGRRDLFFPNLLWLLALAGFEGYHDPAQYQEVINTLLTLPLIALFTQKKIRLVLFIGIPALLIFNLFSSHFHYSVTALMYELLVVAILLLVISIHFGRTKEMGWIFALAAIVLFQYTKIGSNADIAQPTRNIANKSMATVINLSKKTNAVVNSQIQNRPLQYIEQCVSATDPPSIRIGTSLDILGHYLQKVIVPYPLSFYYGYKFISPRQITDPAAIISLLLYLLLLLTAVFLVSRDSLISFGLFVYLISIATFSDYFYSLPGMIGDRYLLLPSIGWCIVFAGILRRFSGVNDDAKNVTWTQIKPIAKYGFGALLMLYGVLTVYRNTKWKDDLTLFRHDISYVSESAQANNLLAVHLMQHTSLQTDPAVKMDMEKEAMGYLKKALSIYPYFFNVAYDIGRVYSQMNMPDSALASFRYAITVDSSYAEAYKNIGDIYMFKGMYPEATPYFEREIDLYPSDYAGYDKLSYNYFMRKEHEKSIMVNKKALTIIPNQPNAYANIGRVYLYMNQKDSARYYLENANRYLPNNAEIHSLLQKANTP